MSENDNLQDELRQRQAMVNEFISEMDERARRIKELESKRSKLQMNYENEDQSVIVTSQNLSLDLTALFDLIHSEPQSYETFNRLMDDNLVSLTLFLYLQQASELNKLLYLFGNFLMTGVIPDAKGVGLSNLLVSKKQLQEFQNVMPNGTLAAFTDKAKHNSKSLDFALQLVIGSLTLLKGQAVGTRIILSDVLKPSLRLIFVGVVGVLEDYCEGDITRVKELLESVIKELQS